jgi:hypothetical protein
VSAGGEALDGFGGQRLAADAVRGINAARMIATKNSAGTSPNRCPRSPASLKDWTPMIVPCTTLDHTVNQMMLLWASGFLDAKIKNTPSVA